MMDYWTAQIVAEVVQFGVFFNVWCSQLGV